MEIIKKCPPPLSLRSRGSLNSLGTRTPLYPQVCSNSPAFAWVGLWWECRWEDGIHHLGWQMPVSIWQTDSPHLSLQHLHQTYQVAHWCLWIWPGSHPLPDPQWWNGCHNLLSQQTLNQSWDALPISQIAAPHPQVGLWLRNSRNIYMDQSLTSTLKQPTDLCVNHGKAGLHEQSIGGQLCQLNFQLYYRSGKANVDADALSRVS